VIAFSAIPVLIFLSFVGTSAAVLLGIAGTSIFVVQGSVMAFAGFFLFWWLLGGLFLASVVTFWFTAGYFGFTTVNKLSVVNQ
jgi:hypothetical protein